MTLIVLFLFIATQTAQCIIRGKSAVLEQIPWQAYLEVWNEPTVSGSEYSPCGATIVSPRTFITAAHCVYNNARNGNPVKAFAGVIDLQQMDAVQSANVSRIVINPSYKHEVKPGSASRPADIAILLLEKPLKMTSAVKAATLAETETVTGRCIMSGFGYYENASGFSYQLRFLERNHSNWNNRDDNICEKQRGSGVCQGDSGGPLVCVAADSSPVLVGVVSNGMRLPGFRSLSVVSSCASLPATALFENCFTSVHRHRDWIRETME